MSSKVLHLAAFMAGAITGGAIAWYFARKKYEHIANEEINSVKEAYSRREAVVVESTEPAGEEETVQQHKESVIDYAARLRREGYLPADSEEKGGRPYVISPDEFGELDDYEQISLTYYSDGTLADSSDEVVENVDELIGVESLQHFGEYEEDSVFVRNDTRRCDYEILLDQRPFSEIIKAKPYLRGKEQG